MSFRKRHNTTINLLVAHNPTGDEKPRAIAQWLAVFGYSTPEELIFVENRRMYVAFDAHLGPSPADIAACTKKRVQLSRA